MNFKENKFRLIAILIVLIVLLSTVFVFLQIGPYNNNKNNIVVDIPSGSGVETISNILYENKLIKNKSLFKLVVKLSKKGPSIKAGKYSLNQSFSNNDILDLLISGKSLNDGTKITIPEGSTSSEIISQLVKANLGDKEKFQQLIKSPSEFYDKFSFLNEDDIISLEGFLYPSTYYFDEKSSEKEIISDFLKLFEQKYTSDLKKKQKELNVSLQKIINLASIVEKEAILDKDRPIVASVFYNRLEKGMPLQSDATIQYTFKERKEIVTYNDLEIKSPFNSYKNLGLPPTPIANPGIKSIKATLYPDKTKYLYFVAKLDGGNNYSETFEQHKKYVKEYKDQRDKLKNENKKN